MSFGAGLIPLRLDDILRARLKTVGVTEFRFDFNKSELLGKFGPGASLNSGWHVYDVGGHRSLVRDLFASPDPYGPYLSGSEVRVALVLERSSVRFLMRLNFDSCLGSLFR